MLKNREIIGVNHEGEKLRDAVLNYVDSKHPNLKKIMLELAPSYEITHSNDSFFTHMAKHYQEKDVEVIIGDRKHWNVLGSSLEEILDMHKNNPLKLYFKTKLGLCKGFFNGKLFKDRNQDMNILFNEQKPEVTIVGGFHAKYLKEKNPETHFSYFKYKNSLSIHDITIKKKADSIYNINKFDPEKKSDYKKKLIKSGVFGSVWLGTHSFLDLPSLAELPIGIFCCYHFLNNLGGAFNYFRALK